MTYYWQLNALYNISEDRENNDTRVFCFVNGPIVNSLQFLDERYTYTSDKLYVSMEYIGFQNASKYM